MAQHLRGGLISAMYLAGAARAGWSGSYWMPWRGRMLGASVENDGSVRIWNVNALDSEEVVVKNGGNVKAIERGADKAARLSPQVIVAVQ